MTVNPKPDALPNDITEIWSLTRPLVIDLYLSREGVIDHVVDATGIDVDPSGGTMTHLELAHLLRYADAQERDDPDRVKQKRPKYEIIRRLGSIYGFPTRSDQDTLIKSQLVHVLIAETLDTTPERFELPSDPDITLDTDPSNPDHRARTPGVAR